MKRIAFTLVLALTLGLSAAWAEGNVDEAGVRYIKAPRFARPIIERWIADYAKTQPGVEFQLVKGTQQKGHIDLSVVYDTQEMEHTKDFSHIVYFGEFAVLPITASSSVAAKQLEGKHLNSKKLKQLFFIDDDQEEEAPKNKDFDNLVVYSGSNGSSVTSAFARNLGQESSSIRGKRIAGDDLFINTALGNDPLGVSFNALPNIFDLESRHLRSGLTIVGLDLKKELAAALDADATLDDLLLALQNGKPSEVAVAKVGFAYSGIDDDTRQFLTWILSQGVTLNHKYGLLNLDRKVAEQQRENIESRFTAQK